MAGEILAGITQDGQAYVHFTKNPFPIMEFYRSRASWELRVPVENRRFSGRGTPPERLILWQLLRAISGEPLGKNWQWRRQDHPENANSAPAVAGQEAAKQVPQHAESDAALPWRLENVRTGEALEGSFSP